MSPEPSDYADSNKSITWSVSSGSWYASISSPTNTSAIINGIGAGTATIRATANDGSGIYAERNIEVKQIYVSSISISGGSTSIDIGGSTTWTATVTPSNATDQYLSWSSSDYSVADVWGGYITGNAAGTASITASATDGSGKSASRNITVKPAVPCPSCHSNLKNTCNSESNYFPSTTCGGSTPISTGTGTYNWTGTSCPTSSGSVTLYGKARCSNQTDSGYGASSDSYRPVSYTPTDNAGSGVNCWCQLCNSSGRSSCGGWVFRYAYVSASDCSSNCAGNCGYYVYNYYGDGYRAFRSALCAAP